MDSVRAGRWGDRSGTNSGKAVFTLEQIQEMKELYKPRIISYAKLAKIYGVHPCTVARALRGHTYKPKGTK
jgi:DNA invertase Pin-like site-specific DNA recombinase